MGVRLKNACPFCLKGLAEGDGNMLKLTKYIFICMAIVIFSLYSFNAYAERSSDFNGFDWVDWSEAYRLGYVIGFERGTYSVLSEIKGCLVLYTSEDVMPELKPEEKEKMQEFIEKVPKEKREIFEMTNKMQSVLGQDKSYSHRVLSTMYATISKQKSLLDFTYGQLLDGLDEFYSDFRNKRIPIGDAIYIVRMQLEGCSEEGIEYMTKELRSSVIAIDKLKREGVKAMGEYLREHSPASEIRRKDKNK